MTHSAAPSPTALPKFSRATREQLCHTDADRGRKRKAETATQTQSPAQTHTHTHTHTHMRAYALRNGTAGTKARSWMCMRLVSLCTPWCLVRAPPLLFFHACKAGVGKPCICVCVFMNMCVCVHVHVTMVHLLKRLTSLHVTCSSFGCCCVERRVPFLYD